MTEPATEKPPASSTPGGGAVPAAETPQESISLPDYDEIEMNETGKAGTDPDGDGTHVTIVEKGWGEPHHMLIALLCLAIVFILPYSILRGLYEFDFIDSLMPSLILTIIVVWKGHHRFFIGVDMQRAEVYMDEFTGELYAYKLGFYVIAPWMKLQQVIDFRNDEVKISAMYDEDKNKTSALRIATNEGYQCDVEWELLVRPLQDANGIKNFLRYKPDVREARIRAVMNSRLSIIGGKYEYQTLLTHFGEVSQWVRQLFKGDGEVTEFERQLGVSVISPRLRSILCNDPAAKKIIETKPTGEQAFDYTTKLIGIGVEPNLASQMGQAMVDKMTITRQEVVVSGLEKAHTAVVGGQGAGAGIVVGGSNNGGNSGNNQGGGNRRRNRGRR